MHLSPSYLRLENAIAGAHKLTWQASAMASNLCLPGFADDLQDLCVELERIQEDLLKNKDRPRRRLV